MTPSSFVKEDIHMFAKKLYFFLLALLISSFALAQTISTTFQVSNDIFQNPERGFFTWTEFLTQPDFNNVNSAGNRLTRPYVRLDSYRDGPIPQTVIDQMSAGFAKARAAGIKVIVRFSYNWGPYPNSDPDATQAQIQAHLQQLAPVFAANEDTIYSMEAGFVGAWGEWHTSTNGLDTSWDAKNSILNSILTAMPQSRFVALRYPSDQWTINGSPITDLEAFSGANRARVGSHNDCFLASDNDVGTWGRLGMHTIDEDKNYIAANSAYSVVGGETCGLYPPRTDCSTALSELARYHFSYLNADFSTDVLNTWKTQGCYDEINRRLGYRLELRKVTYPKSAKIGSKFHVQIDIANTGFAAPMNQRPVYVIFTSGKNVYTILQPQEDVRRWAAGTTRSLIYDVALPASMKKGTYSVYLWLPDASNRLATNPAYSIRFADTNTWTSSTGYNKIAAGISIN